jgi:hypothetical protein
MSDLVDQLDALRLALETELTLRQAASAEWARGNTVGPMSAAHDVSIKSAVEAACALVEKASNP